MFLTQFIVIVSYVVVSINGKLEPFIVGGRNAKIEDFPYSAFLSITCHSNGEIESWICGASIINQCMTLTAGHCLYTCSQTSSIGVTFGHENLFKGNASSSRSFAVHPRFTLIEGSHDIALVALNTVFQFSSKVGRVALMQKPPYMEEALVAGWGIVDEIKLIDTDKLQYTTQYVKDKKYCRKVLKILREGTFCATNKDKSSYASSGDSGGALVVRGYIQIGIVSHKMPSKPNVIIYTDTGYFLNWIRSTAEELMLN